ncbi:MAG: hypothetical protein CO149_04225 [Nitrospirae bacterium CG_4_9_14_3_um_filter_51_5]|nr:MAG: hypothetical protein CO149_04225 [Nitrospirae bacterium CG_4_9_14_3_um_filter_51_5]
MCWIPEIGHEDRLGIPYGMKEMMSGFVLQPGFLGWARDSPFVSVKGPATSGIRRGPVDALRGSPNRALHNIEHAM